MRPSLVRSLPAVLLFLFVAPAETQAKGIVLITHGDTIAHVADVAPHIKPVLQEKVGKANLAVGYKYSYFGIFWLDLWTWDGEYCIFEEKNFDPLTPAQAAQMAGKSEHELGKPFNYRFPIGLLILLALAALFVPMTIMGHLANRKTRQLFEDPRYARAIEIMGERATVRDAALEKWHEAVKQAEEKGEAPPPEPTLPPAENDYEEALQHLVNEGIPREEAEKNLGAMLHHLLSAQQEAEAT